MKDIVVTCIIIITFVGILYLSHDYIQKTIHEHLDLEEAFQESLNRHGKK
jgi:hypothetical protein